MIFLRAFCVAAGLLAVSLGYFDTLMSASAASTSSELSADELEAAGDRCPSPSGRA
jgi:hypothetical protein